MECKDEALSDPMYHANKIRSEMQTLISHLRDDVKVVDDPKAKALFETTAEVLIGLSNAYEHFEQRSEAAWKQ